MGSIFSFILVFLVILFVEFCVFYYFTPNIKEFIRKKGKVDDSFYNNGKKETNLDDTMEIDSLDDLEENKKPIKPLVFAEQNWESDELSDDEIKTLKFAEEEWQDDIYESKSKNAASLLLDVDPDFKLDDFYSSIFSLYADISNHYTDDNLKEISNKLGRELYIANVKQMDSFRKRNLKHIVEVENYLNCQILSSKIIDHDLYVKVELRVSCFDYIIDKSSNKIVSGSDKNLLFCTYRMVLKRSLSLLRVNNPGLSKNEFKPVLKAGASLNDDNWILEGNVVVKRRSK